MKWLACSGFLHSSWYSCCCFPQSTLHSVRNSLFGRDLGLCYSNGRFDAWGLVQFEVFFTLSIGCFALICYLFLPAHTHTATLSRTFTSTRCISASVLLDEPRSPFFFPIPLYWQLLRSWGSYLFYLPCSHCSFAKNQGGNWICCENLCVQMEMLFAVVAVNFLDFICSYLRSALCTPASD